MRNTLPLSSFPLQLLLTIEKYYLPLVSATFFILLLYKTFSLPYTSTMSAQEGVIQGFYFVVMAFRIRLGTGANRTQNSVTMIAFIFLTLIAVVFCIYFLVIQYYVLLVEEILIVLMVVMNAFEFLFGFFSCWQFQSYQKQQ